MPNSVGEKKKKLSTFIVEKKILSVYLLQRYQAQLRPESRYLTALYSKPFQIIVKTHMQGGIHKVLITNIGNIFYSSSKNFQKEERIQGKNCIMPHVLPAVKPNQSKLQF